MSCICCKSSNIKKKLFGPSKYYSCDNCGLLFLGSYSLAEEIDNLKSHYLHDDPYKNVSDSKVPFYTFALNYISSRINKKRINILDIGCGYGYFLEMASKKGWEPYGVEVVSDAVKRSKEKVGDKNIFQGNLKEASLSENLFDAITLWDVIAIIDNPHDELLECYRLMKKGGIIGIRTRNVVFQTSVFQLFQLFKKIVLRFGLKEPYVFNKYCFSPKSIKALLTIAGFSKIQIYNSPLTSGDPYNHMPSNYSVKFAKTCIDICSRFVFWITHGRRLIAPSLLIWAEKS